jgi:hypothetical protein
MELAEAWAKIQSHRKPAFLGGTRSGLLVSYSSWVLVAIDRIKMDGGEVTGVQSLLGLRVPGVPRMVEDVYRLAGSFAVCFIFWWKVKFGNLTTGILNVKQHITEHGYCLDGGGATHEPHSKLFSPPAARISDSSNF